MTKAIDKHSSKSGQGSSRNKKAMRTHKVLTLWTKYTLRFTR